jgi:hypothetical protein
MKKNGAIISTSGGAIKKCRRIDATLDTIFLVVSIAWAKQF